MREKSRDLFAANLADKFSFREKFWSDIFYKSVYQFRLISLV